MTISEMKQYIELWGMLRVTFFLSVRMYDLVFLDRPLCLIVRLYYTISVYMLSFSPGRKSLLQWHALQIVEQSIKEGWTLVIVWDSVLSNHLPGSKVMSGCIFFQRLGGVWDHVVKLLYIGLFIMRGRCVVNQQSIVYRYLGHITIVLTRSPVILHYTSFVSKTLQSYMIWLLNKKHLLFHCTIEPIHFVSSQQNHTPQESFRRVENT